MRNISWNRLEPMNRQLAGGYPYTHHRVYHSHNEFARGKCHVNGIEGFWSYAKRRLAKFNGLSDKRFYLHLKKCEFRFNHRHKFL